MNAAVCSRAIHRTFQNQTRAMNCPTTNKMKDGQGRVALLLTDGLVVVRFIERQGRGDSQERAMNCPTTNRQERAMNCPTTNRN